MVIFGMIRAVSWDYFVHLKENREKIPASMPASGKLVFASSRARAKQTVPGDRGGG
jgi:hypothetical protein